MALEEGVSEKTDLGGVREGNASYPDALCSAREPTKHLESSKGAKLRSASKGRRGRSLGRTIQGKGLGLRKSAQNQSRDLTRRGVRKRGILKITKVWREFPSRRPIQIQFAHREGLVKKIKTLWKRVNPSRGFRSWPVSGGEQGKLGRTGSIGKKKVTEKLATTKTNIKKRALRSVLNGGRFRRGVI